MSNFLYSQTVEVYDSEIHEQPPTNAAQFIAFFQKKLDAIPDVFHNTAHINLDTYHSYGDDYCRISMYYSRPPTEEEVKAREIKAKADAEIQLQYAIVNFARLEKQLKE